MVNREFYRADGTEPMLEPSQHEQDKLAAECMAKALCPHYCGKGEKPSWSRKWRRWVHKVSPGVLTFCSASSVWDNMEFLAGEEPPF